MTDGSPSRGRGSSNRSKTITATYTKLKSGEWGIRVTGGTVAAGQRVTVRKKDGTTKSEVVFKVVWSGGGVSLCTVGSVKPYTPKAGKRLSEEDRCEVCDGDKWTCGHCVGW